MESYKFTQQAVIIAQAPGKTTGGGVQKDQVGIQTGGIDENDTGKILGGLLCQTVDHPDPGSPALLFIVNDGMYHRIGPEGQIAGLFRPGEGRRIGAEVASVRAAPVTEVAGLALSPPLLEVDLPGLGQMGATADYRMSIRIMFPDPLPDGLFHGIHLPGRKKLAVG